VFNIEHLVVRVAELSGKAMRRRAEQQYLTEILDWLRHSRANGAQPQGQTRSPIGS
jgi:hypothetical protein